MGFPPRWLIPRSERGIAWKSLEAFTIEYKHPLTLKPILEVKDTMIFLQTQILPLYLSLLRGGAKRRDFFYKREMVYDPSTNRTH